MTDKTAQMDQRDLELLKKCLRHPEQILGSFCVIALENGEVISRIFSKNPVVAAALLGFVEVLKSDGIENLKNDAEETVYTETALN